jgi:hypothetical protein
MSKDSNTALLWILIQSDQEFLGLVGSGIIIPDPGPFDKKNVLSLTCKAVKEIVSLFKGECLM